MSDIIFVTAGDPERRTGGNEYNRRILGEYDRTARQPVARMVLPEDTNDPVFSLRDDLATQRPRLVVVDSIALRPAALLVDWIRHRLGAAVLALMHMRPSDLDPTDLDLRRSERRLLSAADRVIAVSPDLARRLILAGARPERVAVVPPGRDGCGLPDDYSRGKVGDCLEGAAHGAAPSRQSPTFPRFLTVANWSEAKGTHLVVEALSRLSDPRTTLGLAGDTGTDAYADRVHDLILRRGLTKRVRIHGSLPPSALARLYATADAFVLPSRSEGFGIVYAEAMSFGLPIVATRIGPIPDLVGDAGLLVPPDDAAALARAMDHLAANTSLRRRLSQAATRRAALLPTWSETAERFRAVIDQLLEHRQRTPGRTA